MKVSLIQMAIYEAEPKKNIENVLAWLEKAALDESDVIVCLRCGTLAMLWSKWLSFLIRMVSKRKIC